MKGLFSKYQVTRVDGPTDPKAEYFVLRLDTDPVARIAALEYAKRCGNPELAAGLTKRVHALQGQCERCRGCGRIADSDAGEPWSAWLELPLQSAVAVVAGIVKPIPCPVCRGSGVA